MAKFLHTLPFLKRVSLRKLVGKGYMQHLQRETYKNKEILLMPEDDSVYILINGKIILREHNTANPLQTTVKQVVKPGCILGVPYLDHGISCCPFVWGVIGSVKAQLLKIKRSVFEELWTDSHKNRKEVMHRMFKEHVFFNSLCVQTQYAIVYESGR